MTTSSVGPASRTRIAGALAVALLLAAVRVLARQQPASQNQPTPFRGGVNFVRVDVYPTTKDGRHVADLTAADFEVLEDRVPQRIATFEHIVLEKGRAMPNVERVDPGSTREERQQAAEPRSRLFVLFLDGAHVTDPTAYHGESGPPAGTAAAPSPLAARRLGPRPEIDKALAAFLDRMLGPDDLVAMMTPSMKASQIVFARRPGSIEEYLQSEWATRFTPDVFDADAARARECGWPVELVLKRREERSIQAARDLVAYLSGLREERSTVLLVSEGWMLYRRNDSLARSVSRDGIPPTPGIFVGPDGKLHAGADDPSPARRNAQCDAEAGSLSQLDTEISFRHLIEEANQANTTFYPVDPRGLAAMDGLVGGQPAGNPVPAGKDLGFDTLREQGQASETKTPVLASQVSLKVKLETLQTLANATDGTMTLSNDLTSVVQRVADDLSAYYLLGYSSTNAKTDGAYRRIAVRVKRDGVQVRARRGYRASTRDELAARRPAPEVSVDPETAAVRDAVGSLAVVRDDVPFIGEAGRGCAVSESGGPTPTVWVAGEVTAAGARDTAWQPGVSIDVNVADPQGRALGAQHVDLTPASKRSFLIWLPSSASASGEHTVRVTARPGAAPGMPANLTMRVSERTAGSEGGACVGTPRFMRRGPFSGPSFVPTVDPRFRRQERTRLEVPVAGGVQASGAQLLDRNGKPISVPVAVSERQDGATRWLGAEAALAALAPGEYVMRLDLQVGAGQRKVLKAFRVVP